MEIITQDLNWLAIIVGAILAFMLGWLWYSPKLFGTKWAEGVGLSLEQAQPPALAMITQVIGTFLLSWLIGVLWIHYEIVIIVLALAAFVFLIVSSGFFCKKSAYAILTEVGYIVAMSIVMVVIQMLL